MQSYTHPKIDSLRWRYSPGPFRPRHFKIKIPNFMTEERHLTVVYWEAKTPSQYQKQAIYWEHRSPTCREYKSRSSFASPLNPSNIGFWWSFNSRASSGWGFQASAGHFSPAPPSGESERALVSQLCEQSTYVMLFHTTRLFSWVVKLKNLPS